jgi:branched-subunit amino acid transport protein
MTLTTAIILNAVLMVGIVVALARFIHLPFRIEKRLPKLEHAVYVPGRDDEEELSRAA